MFWAVLEEISFLQAEGFELSLMMKYHFLAMYNTHFFAQILEVKNKDAHYTWVVPEIPCICSCTCNYLLHKICLTIICSKINAKIPL